MKAWTFDDIPDQSGRVAIVTGANTGIGFETARMLALKGARVTLACRNRQKAEAAAARIRAEGPSGTASFASLDLADLDSVRAFSQQFRAEHARLDLLVNNAGVMVPPLGRTRQGYEMQLGTNHLGHFALTLELLPLLAQSAGSRIVIVSSGMQNFGRIDLDDLNWERRSYEPWAAYSQSKLANMMFALELQRRLSAVGSTIRVTAAHPGWTGTDLQRHTGVVRVFNPWLSMKPADGALPTLRAATDPDAVGGTYWGPAHLFELNGPPAQARISVRARDADVAAKLFDYSERATGVTLHGAS